MTITLKNRKRMAMKPHKKKEARLNILIDKSLKDWAHDYAERNFTTLTAVIVRHLVNLKEREKKIDVEQI